MDLNTPINLIITEDGNMLLADSGVTSGSGNVLKLTSKEFQVIAEGFNPPLTGVNYYNGLIYVSHGGFITIIKPIVLNMILYLDFQSLEITITLQLIPVHTLLSVFQLYLENMLKV